jgi:hypothetical protein
MENFNIEMSYLWRWTQGTGQIILTNTQAVPVGATLRLKVQGLSAGDTIEIGCNGEHVQTAALSLAPDWTAPVRLQLPPGTSVLTLGPGTTNQKQASDDRRQLGIGLHLMELRLLPER